MTKTFHIKEKNINKIIEKTKILVESLEEPKLILYFASSSYDHKLLSEKFNDTFINLDIVGCSSHSEFSKEGFFTDSINLMVLDKNTLAGCSVAYIDSVDSIDYKLKLLADKFGEKPLNLNPDKYVGLIFCGSDGKEELFLDTIGNKTDILFLGGTAGDKETFADASISVNGEFYPTGAILLLLQPTNPFETVLTQSFTFLGKTITVDETDETGRIIKKINGKSAVEGYAEALGVSKEEVRNRYFSNPFGLVSGDNIYVKSVLRELEDESILFAGGFLTGVEYEVLQVHDIIYDTKKMINDAVDRLNGCSAIIQASCFYRYTQLKESNRFEEYSNIFNEYSSIGFSAYGEQFIGMVNHSAPTLILK